MSSDDAAAEACRLAMTVFSQQPTNNHYHFADSAGPNVNLICTAPMADATMRSARDGTIPGAVLAFNDSRMLAMPANPQDFIHDMGDKDPPTLSAAVLLVGR